MPSYTEGREARRNGQPATANPYAEGTPMHRNWREGWQESDAILRALEPYQS
jgi:hypothetical protein